MEIKNEKKVPLHSLKDGDLFMIGKDLYERKQQIFQRGILCEDEYGHTKEIDPYFAVSVD